MGISLHLHSITQLKDFSIFLELNVKAIEVWTALGYGKQITKLSVF